MTLDEMIAQATRLRSDHGGDVKVCCVTRYEPEYGLMMSENTELRAWTVLSEDGSRRTVLEMGEREEG